MVRRFYVQNFGCRATQADGAALERQFAARGLEPSPTPAQADVVILNTCTVTASADQDARAAIRRVHRENPRAQIIVTGCYAQRAPEELASLPGVRGVVGNSHKHLLAGIALGEPPGAQTRLSATAENAGFMTLIRLTNPQPAPDDLSAAPDQRLGSNSEGSIFVSDIFAHTDFVSAPVFDAANQRIRPNLKVQEGCDNRCSFCVIPYVRGQSRSLALERVIDQVNVLVGQGHRELVISGINLGRWGRDLPVPVVSPNQGAADPSSSAGRTSPATGARRPTAELPRLSHLICAILERTRLEKLRISSIEPMDWTDELIGLVAKSPRIAKHAHVPMQSGSDAVLRRMHRKYRPWHYRAKIEAIHAAMPTAAIGADVMVGFPGETDLEFEETRRMIEDLPLTYLHVFSYSARPGTPAATMKKQVPGRVSGERSRTLRQLAAQKKLAFMRSFVEKTVEAITLRGSHNDPSRSSAGPFTEALTDNYLKLILDTQLEPNRWIKARVVGAGEAGLVGKVAAGESCGG